jgi:hypothetical protein
MRANLNKRKSKVTFDIPDDLIQELVLLGRKQSVSVRQFIRLAIQNIAFKAQAKILGDVLGKSG